MGQTYAPDDPFVVKITGRVNELAKLVRDQGEGAAAGRERLDKLLAEVQGLAVRLGETSGSVAGLLAAQAEDEEEARKKRQRDWLNPVDTETGVAYGQEWLDELRAWVAGELSWAMGKPLPDCWPWHPRAVIELLALKAHRAAAYTSSSPVPVSDYLARYQVNAVARLVAKDGLLTRCSSDGTHIEPSLGASEVDLGKLDEYVRWWQADRTGTPPGLTKL